MLKERLSKRARITLVSMSLAALPSVAVANDFDAGKVMNQMSSEQRSAYLAGVIEGLAVARYMKDGKKGDGMGCIYDWFYQEKGNLRLIHDAFDKYPTYTPGAIIDVLVKQKCGE